MTRSTRSFVLLAAGMLLPAGTAAAAVTIDGTLDAAYGSALAVQNNETGFGDNVNELNAAYATIDGTTLNLMLTGNLEGNFNKLELFFDTNAGGQNTIVNQADGNPDIDFGALSASKLGGTTFDANFAPDFYLTFGHNGTDTFFNFAELLTGGGGEGLFVGSIPNTGGTVSASTPVGGRNVSLGYALNNSNTAGVSDTTTTGAAAVTTGIELSINLDAIDAIGEVFNVAAFINNTDHDFASNQVLAGLGGGVGNLGNDPDFSTISGDQFFTVVPEPATLGLMLLGGTLVLSRRRGA